MLYDAFPIFSKGGMFISFSTKNPKIGIMNNTGNIEYNKPKIWTKNSKNSEFAVL